MTLATASAIRADEQAGVRRRLEEDIIFGRLAPWATCAACTKPTTFSTSRCFPAAESPISCAGWRISCR